MVFSGLCPPAMVYVVISLIYLVMSSLKGPNIMSIIVGFIFIVLWSWLLNFLCSKGFTIVSWIIVLLPFLALLKL